MTRTLAAALFALSMFSAPRAYANDGLDSAAVKDAAVDTTAVQLVQTVTFADALKQLNLPEISRGAALPSLYGSLIGLQIFDAYTTTRGLAGGAAESNPVVAGFGGNSALIWGAKAAATTTSIIVAERLWRRHRRAQAIGIMLVTNGLMTAVAIHNESVLRAQR